MMNSHKKATKKFGQNLAAICHDQKNERRMHSKVMRYLREDSAFSSPWRTSQPPPEATGR
jgi:hypothetical protein